MLATPGPQPGASKGFADGLRPGTQREGSSDCHSFSESDVWLETLTHDLPSHLTCRTGAHDWQLQALPRGCNPRVPAHATPPSRPQALEGVEEARRGYLSPGGWAGEYLLRPLSVTDSPSLFYSSQETCVKPLSLLTVNTCTAWVMGREAWHYYL